MPKLLRPLLTAFVSASSLLLNGCGMPDAAAPDFSADLSAVSAAHGGDDLEACVVNVNDFAPTGAAVDSDGRVKALTADGRVAFLVQAVWTLTNGALVMREPVNQVTFKFYRPDGTPADAAQLAGFRLVMDMGGHGHTTDECPAKRPEITSSAGVVTIKNINFIMSTRQPDKWLFYKFTATVDGVSGTVARFNVPHKVQ